MNCNNCKNKETTSTTTTTTTDYLGPIGGQNQINYQGHAQYGWICPRCGKVNAPWMATCNCGDYSWNSNFWYGTAVPCVRTTIPPTPTATSTTTANPNVITTATNYGKTLEEADSIFDAYKDYNDYLNVKEEHGRFKQQREQK